MDEDINDVTKVFRSIRDHDYNDLRADIGGLMARVRAMNDAVDDLTGLEERIQKENWAIIPQGGEERLKREDLLVDVLKIVDDGYLSSAWALRETLDYVKDEYAPESAGVENLCEKYRRKSKVIIGLRIYSHHGNSLPIRIIDDAVGEYIGSGEGMRRKIGISVDDIWEKKGGEYHRSPDYHFGHLESNFIHLPVFLKNHSRMVEGLVNEFLGKVLDENSDTVQDYQSMGTELKTLLDSGAHNRY